MVPVSHSNPNSTSDRQGCEEGYKHWLEKLPFWTMLPRVSQPAWPFNPGLKPTISENMQGNELLWFYWDDGNIGLQQDMLVRSTYPCIYHLHESLSAKDNDSPRSDWSAEILENQLFGCSSRGWWPGQRIIPIQDQWQPGFYLLLLYRKAMVNYFWIVIPWKPHDSII